MASLINPKLAIYTSSYSPQSLIMNHQSCIKSKFEKSEQIESPKVLRSRGRFLKNAQADTKSYPIRALARTSVKRARLPETSPVRSARASHHASRNSVVCRTRFRYRFNCLGASCASHLVIYGQDPLLLLLATTFVSVGRMFVVIQVVDVASFLTQLLLLTCFHQDQVPFA